MSSTLATTQSHSSYQSPLSPSDSHPYPSHDSPSLPTPSSQIDRGGGGTKRWKDVFKMGSSRGKGKERERAGLDGLFGDGGTPSPNREEGHANDGLATGGGEGRPKVFERSLTEPSYFPPQPRHQSQSQPESPALDTDPRTTASSTAASSTSNVQAAQGRSVSGLTPLHDPENPSGHACPSTATSSVEQARAYSSHTDTDRSSHSSSSRAHGSHMAGSSASIYTQTSSHLPHRSPGANTLGGFKARFFSNPSSGNSSASAFPNMGDHSPGSEATPIKKNKYKGIGVAVSGGEGSGQSRKKSVGSSSVSSTSQQSPSHSIASTTAAGGQPSPRTPNKTKHRDKLFPPSSPHGKENASPLKAGGSAATRWLRRVVSAPNTKALFIPASASTTPPVPPLPVPNSASANPSSQAQSPSSPIIVVSSTSKGDLDPLGVESEMFHDELPPSPTKLSRSTPSPHAPSVASSLNPMGAVTRGQRAATVSSGTKARDLQAQLGIGQKESHHKQVFRRTYSSNSIKTRSVSVPSLEFSPRFRANARPRWKSRRARSRKSNCWARATWARCTSSRKRRPTSCSP